MKAGLGYLKPNAIDINTEKGDTNSGKKSELPNLLFFLILLALILAMAFFVYLKSNNLRISDKNIKKAFAGLFSLEAEEEAESELLSEFKYELKEQPVFNVYKGNIVECTTSYIRAMDSKGNEKWKIDVKLTNPLLLTSNTAILAADIGGTSIVIVSDKDKVYTKSFEGNIINAHINEQGYISVVHEAKGSKSAVTVLDGKGRDIFTSFIAERFAFSSQVLPSGDAVVINSIDTSGVSTDTKVEFFNILGESISPMITLSDALFPFFWGLYDNSVLAVNESSVICLDKEKGEKWAKEFENGKIISSSVSMDKLLTLALKVKSEEVFGKDRMEIIFLDSSGKTKSTYILDGDVKNLISYGNMAAVNTGRVACFINDDGKLIGKYNAETTIDKIFFMSRKEAVIITKGKIAIVKI